MTNLPFRFRHLVIFALFFVAVLMVSFFFIGYKEPPKPPNPNHVYRTWKLEKLYKNGQSIEGEEKYANLKLKVNKDGTAEWIRPGHKLTLNFQITDDASQVIMDDGYTLENIETIFELNKEKFRFGKRNVAAQYEYVMVPYEKNK